MIFDCYSSQIFLIEARADFFYRKSMINCIAISTVSKLIGYERGGYICLY